MNGSIPEVFITRNHTDDSNGRLLDCIIKVDQLAAYAEELGYECIAVTDHDSLSGHMQVEKVQQKHPNLKIIRGNEIYLVRNGLNSSNYVSGDRYFHFILLAKDLEGHEQLREISTRAWSRAYTHLGLMRVPTYYSDLEEVIGDNKGHLIAASACLGGLIPSMILQEATEQDLIDSMGWHYMIRQKCRYFESLFGEGNFYLELQPSATKEQTYVNRYLVNLSKELNIPYIITEDAHYLKKEDRYIHEAYLKSKEGDRETADFYATTYLMSTEELEEHLTNLTEEELEEAYSNIRRIKDQCQDYTLKRPLRIPSIEWEVP